MNEKKSSQLSQFYKRTLEERRAIVASWLDNDTPIDSILDGGISTEIAASMIENALGVYNLPFGIGTNFLINGKEMLIPMVIEEPSVVAAVSFAAKLFRAGGGFITSSDEPIMIGQIQVLDVPDMEYAVAQLRDHKDALLTFVNTHESSIIKRGGGARDIEIRVIEHSPVGAMLIVHLFYDTRDAMGANAVNTALEQLAPEIETLTAGRVNLRILSNLSDKRKARAKGMIPKDDLARGEFTGEQVIKAVLEAAAFAEVDPYRAATHNKGVMNGIDAVVLATGNDWRAVEAGAHAYAARDGRYTSLTKWWHDGNGNLHGSIELPLAVGIVGGATRVHPTAQLALKILNIQSAKELAEVMAVVGLAQNFAAMRALATEGIQQGHMRMHARQIALAAGALPQEVAAIVEQMILENNIRLDRAKTLVQEWQEQK